MAEQIKLDSFMIEKRKVDKKFIEMPKNEVKIPYKLPKNWKWIRLEEVVSQTQYGLSKAMNTEKVGIPVIRMGNITYDGKLNMNDLKYIEVNEKTTDKYILNKGDILFNRTNSKELVGKTAIFNLDGKYAFVSYLIRVVIDQSKVLPEYVWAYLNSKRGKAVLFNMARQAVQMANINAKELCSIEIPLAPLEEQKRIIIRIEKFVRKVEEAKRLRKIASEEAERIMQAALYKVFSVAKEEGWEWVKLRDILKEDRGTINPQEYPDKEFFLITMDCIESETGRLLKVTKFFGKEIKSMKYRFNQKHILYGKLRPYLNKVYVPTQEGICTTEFIPFIVTKAVREYVAFYLRTTEVVNFAMRHITGTRQPRVIIKDFLEYPIPIPPLEDQKRIIAYLNGLREKIESLKTLQQETEEELENMVPAILDIASKGKL